MLLLLLLLLASVTPLSCNCCCSSCSHSAVSSAVILAESLQHIKPTAPVLCCKIDATRHEHKGFYCYGLWTHPLPRIRCGAGIFFRTGTWLPVGYGVCGAWLVWLRVWLPATARGLRLATVGGSADPLVSGFNWRHEWLHTPLFPCNMRALRHHKNELYE
jgi:hypothetical protein